MRHSGSARALPFAVSAVLLVQPVPPSYAQEAVRTLLHKETRREALAGHRSLEHNGSQTSVRLDLKSTRRFTVELVA